MRINKKCLRFVLSLLLSSISLSIKIFYPELSPLLSNPLPTITGSEDERQYPGTPSRDREVAMSGLGLYTNGAYSQWVEKQTWGDYPISNKSRWA